MADGPLIIIAEDEPATAALGRALAAALPASTVVALHGTLGAGKTRLVQSIAEGLGIDPRGVVSPTFVLMQEYHGRRSIYHVDAYRLRDEDEFWQLGVDEHYADGSLVFIEWADRVAQCLPEQHVIIEIEVLGPERREFKVVARGERYQSFMAQFAGLALQRPGGV